MCVRTNVCKCGGVHARTVCVCVCVCAYGLVSVCTHLNHIDKHTETIPQKGVRGLFSQKGLECAHHVLLKYRQEG